MNVPPGALAILHRLEEAGYQAWIVGGAVRDALLGLSGHDVDITTNARPDAIQALFSDVTTLDVGKAFGTIRVVWDDGVYEVTTYRAEQGYRDGRHPDAVCFSERIEEDLMRRDFTMNAMAWHPSRGLLDVYHGRNDLARGILRAVGDAEERIGEDALRMLRAVRFAARFSLQLEPSLREAIHTHLSRLSLISAERIADELERMWEGAHAERALSLLMETGLWATLFPTLPAEGVSVALFCAVPRDAAFRWAALGRGLVTQETPEGAATLWPVEGPNVRHRKAQAREMRRLLKQLKLPTKRLDRVSAMLSQPQEPLPQTLKEAQRFVGATSPDTEDIVTFLDAEARARDDAAAEREIALVSAFLAIIKRDHLPTTVGDLAISGADVLAHGIPQGRVVGQVLSSLLEDVIDERVLNTPEALKKALPDPTLFQHHKA